MNIRKIIKEEIENFQWMKNIEPQEPIDLTGMWVIINDRVDVDPFMHDVQEKLFDFGFTWNDGETHIIGGGEIEDYDDYDDFDEIESHNSIFINIERTYPRENKFFYDSYDEEDDWDISLEEKMEDTEYELRNSEKTIYTSSEFLKSIDVKSPFSR